MNGVEVLRFSSESSPHRGQQCGALCVVLKDDLFSSLEVCLAMHDKASGAHNNNQQHRGFRHDKNSTNMHPSTTQKTVPMVYWAEDFIFGFFFFSNIV